MPQLFKPPPLRQVAEFAEAVAALALAGVAVRWLPFRWLVRSMGRDDPRGAELEGDWQGVRTAVLRASRRTPWRTVCIHEGLAAHWMLRRRGLASRLHYGIASGTSVMKAHVWVTLGGRKVIGEREAQPHNPVAQFPAGHAGRAGGGPYSDGPSTR